MLSVVIPAYNEEAIIQKTIQALVVFLKPVFSDLEIIVVDDGSVDATAQKVAEVGAALKNEASIRLIQNIANRGKGYSIKMGVLASSGEVIIFIDADLSYDADSIIRIAGAVSAMTPVVIGSRNLPKSEILAHVSVLRFIFGRVFSLMIRFLVLRDIADTQCGLKGFEAGVARKIFALMRVNGFAFDVELLYLARKYRHAINMLPVNLVENSRESRVNLLLDPLKMFVDLFIIRLNDWTGKYG